MLVLSIEITAGSGVGDKILRSNDSLKWPIDLHPSLFVRLHLLKIYLTILTLIWFEASVG